MSKGLRLQKNGQRNRATSLPVKGRKPGKARLKKMRVKKS